MEKVVEKKGLDLFDDELLAQIVEAWFDKYHELYGVGYFAFAELARRSGRNIEL